MAKLFLAAFIVLVLLVLLLLWVISKIVKRLNEKVKSDFLRSLNEYDYHIEKKSKELKELRDEYELYLSKSINEDPVEERNNVEYVVVGGNEDVVYKNTSFAAQYAMVKNVFKGKATEEMNKLVRKLLECPYSTELHDYQELRHIFSQEVRYQMLTLPSDSTAPIMEFIANESKEKGKIVKDYLAKNKNFRVEEFIEYLDSYIYRNDTKITIISPTGERCVEDKTFTDSSRIEYVKDESMVEGYIVKFRDRIYDFSL